jgi:nitrogenase molybdenum-iron protein beta chain
MLGGVLATAGSLPNTIPIIHGAQGCGGALAQGILLGGYYGTGYAGYFGMPSTNISETEVVFGGEKKLQAELENVFDVMEGDLFVLTTSCVPDIIGDDAKAVLQSQGDLPKPVIFLEAGGFKGNSYYGYERLIDELFAQYIPISEEKKADVVNLIGLVPSYDPYFRGDLDELSRILRRLGLRANTFVTSEQSHENLRRAGEASLNIVLSRLYGVKAAKRIKESHGIDYLISDLPIGATATTVFIRQVAERLGLDRELVDNVLTDELRIYYEYVDRATDVNADTDFQNYAVIVANGTGAIPYTKYLDQEIGWIPRFVFVTDDIDEEQKQILREAFEAEDFTTEPELVFETDTFKIQQYIERKHPQFLSDDYYPDIQPVFVLGSTIDRKLADVLGGPLLSVSFPVINRIIISTGYAGYKGGLYLLEDLIGTQLAGR